MWRRRATWSVWILVAGVVAASCASPMSFDEYTDAMETATSAYVTESQNLSYDFQSSVEDGVRDLIAQGADPTGADPASEAVDLVRDHTVQYLSLLSDAMDRYRDAIAGLEPPSIVSDAHAAYVDSVTFAVGAIPDARASVEVAESLDDVQTALSGSEFADGQLRWIAACTAVEEAVRGQGRGLDLQCVQEASS